MTTIKKSASHHFNEQCELRMRTALRAKKSRNCHFPSQIPTFVRTSSLWWTCSVPFFTVIHRFSAIQTAFESWDSQQYDSENVNKSHPRDSGKNWICQKCSKIRHPTSTWTHHHLDLGRHLTVTKIGRGKFKSLFAFALGGYTAR